MSFLSKVARLFSPSSSAAAIVPTGTAGASRTVARERLSVILASQRGSDLLAGVDMDRLQDDVLNVVKRHIEVAQNSPINCQVRNEGDVNLFEMSVEIEDASRNNTRDGRRANINLTSGSG